MKLNEIKRRESYRPVAPMCTEESAAQFFSPGTPDPFMLFDHMVRTEYLPELPAIAHLDGSARLQTVSASDNQFVWNVLNEFGKITGYPVLCNTSANQLGSGFFPDLDSVVEWGRVDKIWSDGFLYTRT